MFERNRALGKIGEDIAARFLSRKRYRIIARNVKLFVGEIDLIAKSGPFFVFVEVKTRKNLRFGPPYLAVTEKKAKKLIHCAMCYLKMKYLPNVPWRIDVISIEMDPFDGRLKKVEHFEDAITEERN